MKLKIFFIIKNNKKMSYIQVKQYLNIKLPLVLCDIILSYSNEYIDKYNLLLNYFKYIIFKSKPTFSIFSTIFEYNIKQKEYKYEKILKNITEINVNSIIRHSFLQNNINFPVNHPTLNYQMNRSSFIIVTKIENNKIYFKFITPNFIKNFYKSCIAIYDINNIQTTDHVYSLYNLKLDKYVCEIKCKKFYYKYNCNFHTHVDYRVHNKYYPNTLE